MQLSFLSFLSLLPALVLRTLDKQARWLTSRRDALQCGGHGVYTDFVSGVPENMRLAIVASSMTVVLHWLGGRRRL